jgi:glyoxylase-like metal-dependent hydrolase (beta-lactamase superfamily II)
MTSQTPSPAVGRAQWTPVTHRVEWFEIRHLGDGIHLIAEPGHVNSFLVVGDHAALLFDSGLGIGRISEAVSQLTNLPLIVVNSHDHLDHRGGNADLLQRRAELGLAHIAAHPLGVHAGHDAVPQSFLHNYEMAMRRVYADYLAYMALDSQSFYAAMQLARMRPLPELSRWCVPAVRPTRALLDGEVIDLGGRALTVLHTPGHAPDSICLFESGTGILLAGDTLVAAAFWLHGPQADLDSFVSTTARLAELPLTRILTAHNLVAETPGGYAAEVAHAAQVVRSGESIPRPGADLLGNRVTRHEVDDVVILTPPGAAIKTEAV